MNELDLFSGLEGASVGFKERGHKVVSVDMDPSFKPTIVADLFELRVEHDAGFNARKSGRDGTASDNVSSNGYSALPRACHGRRCGPLCHPRFRVTYARPSSLGAGGGRLRSIAGSQGDER